MSETPTEQWEIWYRRTHDELTKTIAELRTTSDFIDQVLKVATEKGRNPQVPAIQADTVMQFLAAIMRNENALYAYGSHALDFEDLLWKKFDTVTEKLDSLVTRIEHRDAEITKTLKLLLAWKKFHQPTLDEAKTFFEDKAARIGKL